jgi:hypothetical protein
MIEERVGEASSREEAPMRSLSRNIIPLLAAMLVGLIAAGTCHAQKNKADSKSVPFKTFDGVELSGTLYPAAGSKARDAVVLLIPDVNLKKGGGIQQNGWSDLAKTLQKNGYVVFSFDFRGFGESKTVDPVEFWKHSFNLNNFKRKTSGGKRLEKIDYKDFHASYIPYLVNDIAAAKAFLDRENDRKACNTSNLIVIGAGQGATLGAMWVANECKRRKDKNPVGSLLPMLGDSEGKSIAGAVWLTISPTLGDRSIPVRTWVVEAGKTNKIPMAFITGKNDTRGSSLSSNLVRAIKGTVKGKGNDKDLEFTGVYEVPDVKLTGHNLLVRTTGVDNWILKNYLAPVMEKRGAKEWVERKVSANRFYYATPTGVPIRVNKLHGVDVPSVEVSLFLR